MRSGATEMKQAFHNMTRLRENSQVVEAIPRLTSRDVVLPAGVISRV